MHAHLFCCRLFVLDILDSIDSFIVIYAFTQLFFISLVASARFESAIESSIEWHSHFIYCDYFWKKSQHKSQNDKHLIYKPVTYI